MQQICKKMLTEMQLHDILIARLNEMQPKKKKGGLISDGLGNTKGSSG